MPGFVGAVQIITMGSSAVFHIGDVFQINPISNSKTFAGAGSFNTGDQIRVTNEYSATNTYDSDGVDQPMLFNL
ncbi:spore germination protein [Lederbergia lenta]|uniref:Spore germination protein GerPA n=1 Tax=Lederbergia lenta TaxID=1467 RepID=A0A2X4WTE0_LEDLE|nr:spore germination protein [Lederbergia lenta]MCM3110476.1 spore germination protein [Lederbergia lenta]MEC2323958.1 spore germination protein [Lederbergia lenta]SQI60900.1 spore germination protein GerPA [Lederbergia lenta]